VKISATIITFNEEKNIAKAIRSVLWAHEVIVIDSNSTDKTVEIAKELGAKVVVQPWLGFAKQKQFAVNQATNDWIFSLDADEIVSNELATEINKLKNINNLASGFRIPRLSFYMNQPIRHCGWYPDTQIRLFNRTNAKWKNVLIHESIEVDGKINNLRGDIHHYSVENAGHHHKMIGERYAPLSAQQMFANGRKTSRFKVKTIGIITFLQVYLLKLGFLDGFPGFCIARFAAHHAFLKHLLLWEMQNQTNP
jgi:glycosyltransferase involved in cell wall biosynthesis